jgi:hypothetical protein
MMEVLALTAAILLSPHRVQADAPAPTPNPGPTIELGAPFIGEWKSLWGKSIPNNALALKITAPQQIRVKSTAIEINNWSGTAELRKQIGQAAAKDRK